MKIKNQIKLKSDTIKVLSKYKGKSKFDFWINLQINDILIVTMFLEKTGSNRGVSYVPNLTVLNLRTEEEFCDSLNGIVKYLEKIDYE